MKEVSRRRFLLGTSVATAGLAGCTGGGETDTSNGGGSTDSGQTDASGGSSGGGGDQSETSTPNNDPDPDCTRLEGSPTPFDVAGTPFVFTFDYIDSWQPKDPLAGPKGRVQGFSSATVTVDGETESAGLTVMQSYEAMTAAQVDEAISDAVSGDYARFEVVAEQEFNGETVRVVGSPDEDVYYYKVWLPYGDGDARYYPLELSLMTSIVRLDEENVAQPLCVDATVASIETVRESLAVNPESTIEEV
ncbi:hypothetical protein [Haloarchaeobius sp. HME9146]|uniref:hypothetical protein n=1 Tax=Haloarchaeobius sp. HME9146 TaxID=2978732 RepID=UPI0021BEE0F3|nr:hypothetical protein [Haloarchaeobius sp. HME9146]MCT9098144.1 hypothetical protein [Haloarchaeobius sp. HME9146]